MFIGVISDTHGVFDDEFRRFFEPCDEIWHAGDWGGGAGVSESLRAFKPVVGVYGNCDGQEIRFDFPSYRFFEREGVKVLMTHIGGYPGHYDIRAHALIERFKPQIFVCGHSHILKVMNDPGRNMLCINPGAAGLQGWQVVRTALRFHIDSGHIGGMEVFELPRR